MRPTATVFLLVTLVSVSILSGTGCRAKPPTYPATIDREEAGRIVISRLAGITGLRAEVGLTFARGDESRSASGALVVERPDRVRLKCWGPLGVDVLDLLVADGFATLHLPRESRALRVDLDALRARGDVLEPRFRSLLLVESILGELDTPDGPHRLRDDTPDGRGVLEVLRDGSPSARIEFDRSTLLPVTRTALSDPVTVIRYEDYQLLAGRWWPGEIRVESGDLELRIKIHDLEINPDLPSSVFEIHLPRGIDVETP